MRESAVFAMGRSADPFWAESVLAELYNDSPSMRYEAARACGELELHRAVGRLIDLIADPDLEVKIVAVWALGQIGGDRSRNTLERLSQGEDETLGAAASEALDEMRLLTRPMDLLLHTVGESAFIEIEVTTREDSESAGYDHHEREDDAWEDSSVDPNRVSDG
ncbi:unnamed protein product [marine sediment metagenome]|uniref:HEAT repeat domain-containing protein n=1 Tax=marine sediment metagenome TaxID=412755 RepID=X0U9H4_9ZZZZ